MSFPERAEFSKYAPQSPNKRALVFVTDAYGGHGGIAKFNRDLLSSLASHPQYQEIIALPRGISGPLSEPLPETLRFNASCANSKIAYVTSLIGAVARNRAFDVVVCGHIHLLPLAWIASRLARSPLILICHGIEAWQPTSRWIVNRLVKKIDYVISVSAITQERFQTWAKATPKAVFILPNSVDMARFKPQGKNSELVDRYNLRDKVVLMTFGRLERSKGIDEILEILPNIARDIPNIVYMIVGGGADLDRLQKKANALSVDDRVIFAGRIEETEKVDYYNLADVFVMPGRGEGFGIVYLEAMACGVPVVGSVLDGSKEALLDGRLGVLVNPLDLSSVEQGIRKALAHRKGVPAGLDYFSWPRFQERVLGILHEVSGVTMLRNNRHD